MAIGLKVAGDVPKVHKLPQNWSWVPDPDQDGNVVGEWTTFVIRTEYGTGLFKPNAAVRINSV